MESVFITIKLQQLSVSVENNKRIINNIKKQ